jgi:tRNA (guanine37-N1)-methyltransferase
MRFDVLTLFPSMFRSPFEEGVIGRALERGRIALNIHDLRDYAVDRHRVTDDYPFGGGEGMVMKADPIVRGIEDLQKIKPRGHVILLAPQGKPFVQSHAVRLSMKERLILICGRYEGVDERVMIGGWVDEELSIGDYILTGGELAAMVVIEVAGRLIPGVVGNESSLRRDTFQNSLLKYPQHTRPVDFRGMKAPEVLISGHHEMIRKWRRKEALKRTWIRRPDLFQKARLSKEDEDLLEEIKGKGQRGME